MNTKKNKVLRTLFLKIWFINLIFYFLNTNPFLGSSTEGEPLALND